MSFNIFFLFNSNYRRLRVTSQSIVKSNITFLYEYDNEHLESSVSALSNKTRKRYLRFTTKQEKICTMCTVLRQRGNNNYKAGE
jgi:hypothetical protein